ncbi:amidophosphoribosyltransferase-like isoform X2 [Apostichopus japonicus]|uniref:amidophosphoribosyltransferase-like isoform X2 n=1 Tax=Stichopus japonicus TaxID=307972 RepID=UPI003AB3D930
MASNVVADDVGAVNSNLDDDVEDDYGLREACGVFGCVAAVDSQLDVPQLLALGLTALQHRGQESAGMITGRLECASFKKHIGMGMVSQIFTEEILGKMRGDLGIGHTRYSTAGSSALVNCQPFEVETLQGKIAVAHNGELINCKSLRQKVLKHGIGLSSSSDSEVITQLLCGSPPEGEPEGVDWEARIKQFMNESPLSYAVLVMFGPSVYAFRDPYGNRPLCVGSLQRTAFLKDSNFEPEGWVVSSESCAFQSIGAKFVREVLPGEIVQITNQGIKTLAIVPRPKKDPPAFCIFEYVYFARPDSLLQGQMVYSVRMRCGRKLAKEAPVEADIVSTVPESATPAALGYSEMSGIPYAEVLTKNRYVGRTFIQPSTRLRQLGVAKKFGALTENFVGKKVVLIDDSIVRGNTIAPIIRLLKTAGASEVHIRVASPPVKYPCYMGINIPTKQELIANQLQPEQLADHFGADSVVYLTIDGLLEATSEGMNLQDMGKHTSHHCTACLSGKYPVQPELW